MAYQVGIDLGTSSAVAAVCRPDGTAHVVPLGGPGGAVPSAVYLGADGTLLVGEAAQRRALTDPGRVVRELTRCIGDATPLLVGREPVPAADLAARFLARLVDDVARHEGGVAARVAVTHPGSWGPHRLESLRAALGEQGLGSAVLVPQPVAAVVAHATAAPLRPGATVGVYDLGGGRFEASVVRGGPGGLTAAGPSQELGFGGADLDEVVFGHVRDALGPAWEALDPADPEVLAAVAELRRECTAAKEALSRDTEVLVPVALPGVRTHVRLGRAEFEDMIRADVAETVDAMRRALDDVGTTPAELAALVVVGGSARVPLVPQLLGEAFGRGVVVATDPVGSVALGAALLAGEGGRRRSAGGPDPRVAVAGGGGGTARAGGAVGAAGAGAVAGAAGAVAGAAGVVVGATSAAGGAGAAGRAGTAATAAGVRSGGPGAGARGADARMEGRVPGPPRSAAGEQPGTAVLPVARPPKQARPFTPADTAAPSRSRRVVLLASASALALAMLGGVVTFGIGRVGATSEAGAVTPTPVVGSSVTAPSIAVAPPPTVVPETRVRAGAPPARRGRQAPPAAVPDTPPATTAPPTTPPPPTPEQTAPAQTATPEDDGGGKGGGNGAGEGDPAGGAAGGTGDAGAADAPAAAAEAPAVPVAPTAAAPPAAAAAPAAQADDAGKPAAETLDAAQ